jgi:hypothetical protein
MDSCAAAGFPFAGVEYATQCFCGTSIVQSGSDTGSPVSESDCNSPCSGDNKLACGAGKRIMIFNNPSVKGVNVGKIPSGWSQKGCFSDLSTNRALTGWQSTTNTNTPENCMNACAGKGYPFAGVEYGAQCFCGNSIVKSGDTTGSQVAITNCNQACSGNGSLQCGAGKRIMIFNNPSMKGGSNNGGGGGGGGKVGSSKVSVAWTRSDTKGLTSFKNRSTPPKLYNWSAWKTANIDSLGFEFCPMFWGTKSIKDFKSKVVQGYAKCVLGQNEPDHAGQSNMSVDTALSQWNQYICPLRKKGYKLISPATTSSPTGVKWITDFIKKSQGACSPDAVAAHWYGTSFSAFKSHIDTICKLGKPVWVTEFACQDFSGRNQQCSPGQIRDFLTQAKNYLENNPCVQEYFWFGAFTDMGNVNAKCSLVNGDMSLNSLGKLYVNGQ